METCLDPDALKTVSFLPPPFQTIFKFRYFNPVQSESFAETFLSDVNMVVSAPTGSGKTVLFELCILRLLRRNLTPDGRYIHAPGALKMVYIAPLKALVQEKARDWGHRFGGNLGLKCQELTGDSDVSSIKDMQETDIFLTTPEKFDSITRRHRDHGVLSFFGDIALLLLDEVHLLSDPRGAALEAVVSRMKMLARYPELKGCPLAAIRMVAVSATIPNIEDLADWLQAPKQGLKRFGEETRPVKLTTKVYGYSSAKNDFLFERIAGVDHSLTPTFAFSRMPLPEFQRLQGVLFETLMQHSQGKPTLVFCSTRRGAQEAAVTLADAVSKPGFRNPFVRSQGQLDRLQAAASASQDKQMQACIRCGVGFHNGGLGLTERNLVESLFSKGDLQVLCTTNTLAQGVNLPAYLVIIKSTQYYNKDKGGYVEYERSTVAQMCGRAGRPQFGDSGAIVVMTRKETVHLYENILAGTEAVESQLLSSIAEHLNAEIVLMTVTDVSLAIDWLKCSFLYVRLKKNPQHYEIQVGLSDEQLENYLKEMCLTNINALAKYGMIHTDEYGYVLNPLEPGRLMTKFYLKFATMKTIVNTTDGSSMADLLRVLTKAEELSWIKLRRHEKKLLNSINTDTSGRIKFPVLGPNGKVKKRIQSDAEKIFVLTNDALTGDPVVQDFTMTQDVNGICSNGSRIVRCMSEYFKLKRRFKETVSSLKLAKCLHQKLWEGSPYQLRQLHGIGVVTAKALVNAGIDTFEKFAEADPRRIEALTSRKFPFGNQIKESLDGLPPKIAMKMELVSQSMRSGKGKTEVKVSLTRESQNSSSRRHFADLIVGSEQDNKILFAEKIRLEHFPSPYVTTINKLRNELGVLTELSAVVISEEYVGVDVVDKLILANHENRINGQPGKVIETRTSCSKTNEKTADLSSCKSLIAEPIVSFTEDLRQENGFGDVNPLAISEPNLNDGVPAKSAESACGQHPQDGETSRDEGKLLATGFSQSRDRPITSGGDSIFDHIRKKAKTFQPNSALPYRTAIGGTESASTRQLPQIPTVIPQETRSVMLATKSKASNGALLEGDPAAESASKCASTARAQALIQGPTGVASEWHSLQRTTQTCRGAAQGPVSSTTEPSDANQWAQSYIDEDEELNAYALNYRSPPRSPRNDAGLRVPSDDRNEPPVAQSVASFSSCQQHDSQTSAELPGPDLTGLPPWDMRGTLVDGLSIFSLLCQ